MGSRTSITTSLSSTWKSDGPSLLLCSMYMTCDRLPAERQRNQWNRDRSFSLMNSELYDPPIWTPKPIIWRLSLWSLLYGFTKLASRPINYDLVEHKLAVNRVYLEDKADPSLPASFKRTQTGNIYLISYWTLRVWPVYSLKHDFESWNEGTKVNMSFNMSHG